MSEVSGFAEGPGASDLKQNPWGLKPTPYNLAVKTDENAASLAAKKIESAKHKALNINSSHVASTLDILSTAKESMRFELTPPEERPIQIGV